MRAMTETTPKLTRKEKIKENQRKRTYEILVIVAFLVGLLTGYLLWGSSAPAEPAAPAAPEENTRFDVPVEGYPSIGPKDAKVVVVEFSDFECPFCTRWHESVFYRMMEEYDGQILFVYRNFPLTNIHPNAMKAAEAALCAGNQGYYWEYHEMLFKADYGLGISAFTKYAEDLGLNMDTFTDCLENDVFTDFIREDMNEALEFGVGSTPSFFINGRPVVGTQPYAVFQQIIEEELAADQ